MSTTVAFAGKIAIELKGVNSLAGGQVGTGITFAQLFGANFQVSAVSPDIEGGGGYADTFTCPSTGGTLNLADSTNICKTGAVGTIPPAQGYVITAVKKLRALYLKNTDASKIVTVTIPATLGLAGCGWAANAVVVVLQPGASWSMVFPNGSSVLTAGSNDALVFTSDSGTPTVAIGAIFG